ncbi:hypothetical protein MKZ01_13685 [Lysinibacillus endophyticus]|uniref:Uncharacterized protein n=1 Tax=Ureibacillus endophyticus TaxID=1978490 RepID=A0A494YZP2_9BACL|nr:hypothetical protein [Lysinibacillus endophyticus]RKQ15652.1 hypothetical protein D8M03_11625 [Lysinibacillus endophyticus]
MVLFKKIPYKKLESVSFTSILQQLSIDFHSIPEAKCDERTLYITISLSYYSKKSICDLIFLLDRPTLAGAISLNEHYDPIRRFFMEHFDYTLCYEDEILIANTFMKTNRFKEIYTNYTSNIKRPHESIVRSSY